MRKGSGRAAGLDRSTKAGRREYARRVRAERQERVNALKAGPCKDCGGTFPPCAMDFDHVRGEKIGDVAYLLNRLVRWELVLEEIAKCDLVCANCHRIRHWRSRESTRNA